MTRVIGIVSGKGGVGKTTLVSNLALSLKEFGERVAAVDCNVTTPHLSHYLGAYNYQLSLNDVLKGNAIITNASYYHNGIIIVPASQNLEDLMDSDMSNLKSGLEPLKSITDIMLLDSAPGLGREALSVLNACDEVLFVSNPLTPAINDVQKCAEVVRRLGVKINGIVLNMVRNEGFELTTEQVEKMTGIPVIASIPFDKEILNGLSQRSPIVDYKPNSPSSLACATLASGLLGLPVQERKSVISSVVDSFRRLASQKGMVEAENQNYSGNIRTDADRMIEIVNMHGSIGIRALARKMQLSKEETSRIGKTLGEHGLVEFKKPLFREARLRSR
jgi:septum site-determining protein MinD